MTLTEFEQLAATDDGRLYELDEGELVILSPTARPHSKRLDVIYRYLVKKLPEETFDILPGELGFVLQAGPKPTVRGADLAVMPHEDTSEEGFSKSPPLLAVEVVSPSNTPEDMEKKRIQYLQAGTQEVWIVYNKTKTMHVYFANASAPVIIDKTGSFMSTLDFEVEGREIFR